MNTAQFALPSDRQIHSLPHRAQQSQCRPTPCETRQTKEPPCKVRRLEYRQPRYNEKNTFRSYREPTRIPSDTTATTNDEWGSSDDDASTDRALTEIEQELGTGRELTPTVEEEEGDEVDDVLRGSSSPTPTPTNWALQTHVYAASDTSSRGEKRRRRVESFRGQKRRKSEVSSDEDTDTSDDEIFPGWDAAKEARVKSPKITTVYVPQSAPVPVRSRVVAPSASVAELARRIRCLDAAGSDIIMTTDTEGEEDEAMVSAALYSLSKEQEVSAPQLSRTGANAQPSVLRLALIKRREQQARMQKTKAPLWARESAADPNRAFWAKYMYATTFARTRARCDEYGDKLPGQRSNRYIRKIATPYSGLVPRPGLPKAWAPNALCLGQINIYLIRETVQAKRHRRDVKLAYNARVEEYIPRVVLYWPVGPWWEKQVPLLLDPVQEDDEEVVEEGLLPPVEVGDVDLQAAGAMYSRRLSSAQGHEITDEVEDVDDEDEVDAAALAERKRARSESAEPRESTDDRNRRINEDIAVEMGRRVAVHAQREARALETREVVQEASVAFVPRRVVPVPQSAPPPATRIQSAQGQVLGSLPIDEPVESSASSDQDELESILAPASEPQSTSSSTSESERSDPPNYEDLHPIPVSLPIRPSVLATLPRRQPLVPARPPAYQPPGHTRGSGYHARRTPSPPPPFNAQTDALTLIAPRFVPYFISDDEDDDGDVPDPVLARMAPSRSRHVDHAREIPQLSRAERLARMAPGNRPWRGGSTWEGSPDPPDPEEYAIEEEEREREQRLVGAFPRPSTPETPTPLSRARRAHRGRAQAPREQVQSSTRPQVPQEPLADPRLARLAPRLRSRLTEHALRQHTRALQAQSQVEPVEPFDAARDMESANELEAELNEVDAEEGSTSLVSGLRRWVGRFWG